MICPNCGKDRFVCGDCSYTENNDIWMQSRHDMETFAAKLDNVKLFMPELWIKLERAGCFEDSSKLLTLGASVYKIPKLTYAYKITFSRKTCPICRSDKIYYTMARLRKHHKLLCLDCGSQWKVKFTSKPYPCERRVIRLPLSIYTARGEQFQKPAGDREQRASDVRSPIAYLAAHRRR